MKEIIKDVIIPIVTSFIGAFLGGFTYNSYKCKKEFLKGKSFLQVISNKINGDNSKMINGDNYEYKIRK